VTGLDQASGGVDTPTVLCFGAVHMDTIAHARQPVRPDTSTPARFTQTPGGVAANVARALARLGVDAHLFGARGADSTGHALVDQFWRSGVHTHLIERPDHETGRYIAFHDPDGALAAACVDDAVLETAPADLFDGFFKTAVMQKPGSLWFADANMPPALLERVTSQAPKGRLVLDAVSRAKAPRLRPVLKHAGLVFLNRAEAIALLDREDPARPDRNADIPIRELASGLIELGTDAVVITLGRGGLYYARGDTGSRLAAPAADVTDTTGAGDALIAGTVAGLARDMPLEAAVQAGLQAARMTLENTGAVPHDMSWEKVSQHLP